jgi:hypothetical protein
MEPYESTSFHVFALAQTANGRNVMLQRGSVAHLSGDAC